MPQAEIASRPILAKSNGRSSGFETPEILARGIDAEEKNLAVHAPFSSVRKALVEKTPATQGRVTTMPGDPIRREIMRMMLDGASPEALGAFVAELRTALDR